MAFACRPRLIVLDEPTTGLDVTTQRRVLDTVRGLCRSYQVAAVYITHDLAVVAEIADHVAVLYAGRLIEIGQARELFATPAHPYTRGLMRAVPVLEGTYELHGMAGSPPRPGQPAGRLFLPAAVRVRGRPVRAAPAGTRSPCPRPATSPGACAPWRSRRCPAATLLASARRPRPRNRCSRSAACRSPTRTSRCCVTSTSSGGQAVGRDRRHLGLGQDHAGQVRRRAAQGLDQGPSRSPARISRPASATGRKTSCARSSSSRRTRTPRSTPGRPSARSSGIRSRTSASFPAAEHRQRIGDALTSVALRESFAARYPDELSGGETPAGRAGPRPGRRPRPARLRRGHLGARRVGAGGDRRAAAAAAGRARALAAVHHAQPAAGAEHRERRDGDQRRGGLRARPGHPGPDGAQATPTPDS